MTSQTVYAVLLIPESAPGSPESGITVYLLCEVAGAQARAQESVRISKWEVGLEAAIL